MVKVNDNLERGEELNQLSRILFDSAAYKWFLAVLLELLAGILSLVLSLQESLTDQQKLFGAAIAMCLLIIAYVLRQFFETQYDLAETMRRQSVLTEGIGLNIKDSMFSEWRRRAGKKVLSKFSLTKRNNDYYKTRKSPGPHRLLEMTQESAFWTRFLYGSLLAIVRVLLVISIVLLGGVILAILTGAVPKTAEPAIAYVIFLIVPVLLTSNLVGWMLKLQRLIQAIYTIENDMDDLVKSGNIDEASVLRLVFEYNCQVVSGFPILPAIFKQNYSRIHQEWIATHKDTVRQ